MTYVEKPGNSGPGVGEWLLEERLLDPDRNNKAILWPSSSLRAESLLDNGVNSIIVADPRGDNLAMYAKYDSSELLRPLCTTHELPEELYSLTDLEYGWAIDSDTLASLDNPEASIEDAMRKIAETSENLLRTGGYAVYNMKNVGSTLNLWEDNGASDIVRTLSYAEDMKDLLEEDYADEVRLYEDPDMLSNSPHLVWRK